ncbi:MAG: hypothetical protein K2K50_00365, partial [Anaeroplasmataceae bacterium]|nr:hypothetical protein [Anaeroplasmataceae bacterium]
MDENNTQEEPMDELQKKTLDKLYDAWAGTFDESPNGYDITKRYISQNDKAPGKVPQSFFDNYKTHVVPLPFWGNIKDPDYIVLGLNPSYEPFVDELESSLFYDELKNTLEESSKTKINWLDKNFDLRAKLLVKELNLNINDTKINKISKNNKVNATAKWWNEVFDIEFKNEEIKKSAFGKIAFFNLCGYHSGSFNETGIKALPTVKATIEYVKCLMKTQTEEKKDRRIILICGAIWKEYIYA